MVGRATAFLLGVLLGCHPAEPKRHPTVQKPGPSLPLSSTVPPQATATHPTAEPQPAVTSAAAAASVAEQPPAPPAGMLLVPGGTFTMGTDRGGEPDERPAHQVTVASFYLDRLEVTVGEYLACVEAKLCPMYRTDVAKSWGAGDDARFRRPNQPISGISQPDALSYCSSVGKRLPTEAEWERAARGDDDRHYPWGNAPPDPKLHGCFGLGVGPTAGTTADVGSFPLGKGPYGHLDLAGNVWEWTADHYDPYAYRRATRDRGVPGTCQEILRTQEELRSSGQQGFTGANPIPTECERVLRGGAFNYPGPGLRVTNRVHHPENWRILVAGFRCAKDLTTP
jgi:formylglycine-generating enzyme required for sulfatase activity